jgi:molybdopterin synthase sulfur carrier subunit
MAQSTFHIYYFASASSYTKKDTETLPAPLPLSDLFAVLENRYPGIRERVLRSCGVSLGLEYVDVEEAERGKSAGKEEGPVVVIRAGDEVGIIPPVSSG